MDEVVVRFEGPPTVSHLLRHQLEQAGYKVEFRGGPPTEFRSLDQVAAIVALVLAPGEIAVQADAVRKFLRDWRERHPGSEVAIEDDWRDGKGYL